MAKDNYLKIRCTDKMKSSVEAKAKENNMSVTAYLEYLIMKDISTMRVVRSDYLTEEIERRLISEESCYLSSNKDWWLFTDIDVLDQIIKGYKFNTEIKENIYTHSIEEYLQIICEDMTETFIEKQIQFSDYIESTMKIIEDDPEIIYCNDWDKTLINLMKVGIIANIEDDLEDGLKKLKKSGYDIGIIKHVCDNVLKE